MSDNREHGLDEELQDDLDRVVRRRLQNWAAWTRLLQEPKPNHYPNPQPMFRGIKSGWNEEDADQRQNLTADIDDAERVEAMVCMLSKHNQSVIYRYFVQDRNTVECSRRIGMSQRKFDRWLSQAIGQLTIIMLSQNNT